ncbi:histone-lysine N-methyltransferase 2C-like isoform X3 [Photinus pyralis]|uniref:histone-lysine N-methyltransferase 2C-like isoform X3 n=1 Tax=Photinus pyralis TaxID=7054 RepID=UPI001267355E|nr:histone-lysine N-methyltransferase 2C-like isoform X3 [Photinus pyralis]
MESIHGRGIETEQLMEIDEGDGSDVDDEDEDLIDDPLPSPLQLSSSGAASTATSTTSSPNNDEFSLPYLFSGKPLNIKRGRGRPRREGGKSLPRRTGLASKIKRLRGIGYTRGLPKKVRPFDKMEFEYISSSLGFDDPNSILDPETGTFIIPEKEKLALTPDDTPYPPELWPGKVCALCNLGERSQLGQRDLLRLSCPEGFIPQRMLSNSLLSQVDTTQITEREIGDKSPRGPVTCRRQKSFNKCRNPSLSNEYVDELSIIGYLEQPDVQSVFDSSGYFYVHRNCAAWSNGVIIYENSGLENVGQMVLYSISKKCSYCHHFGASLTCKAGGCSKQFHFPCATASGAFQELRSVAIFCVEHLAKVPLVCESSVCYTCKMHGDIANLMFCSSCGEHYHGTCVGLAQLPGVRAGWQCRKCRVCQVCRMVGDESKLMACEQCDKIYHAICQRPIVTTIPKYGWKCKCCRVCGDCGSRTPGAGLSSRWHAHYTVCDSCYQQRNKGFCCPLCHRAYRAHAHREMVQCSLCRKFVHGTCDPDADLATYHQRKEAHPEYDYICLICKSITQQNRQLMAKRNSFFLGIEESDCLSGSSEFLFEDSYEFDFDRQIGEDPAKFMGLGKGKPYSASKIAKKRLGLGTVTSGRPKGIGKGLPGKVGFTKRQRLADFGRKRGPKSKMRGIFGVPGVGLQRPTCDGKTDEEPGLENRLVLCSAKDKFVLTQDICVMCGALGTDQEGCLIACVQCGQCYHPYCVNVKVTKVILQKGWRCLDCTVCEGCGQRNDEGRLILCDECDISYHIYCMDPPLDYVPHGNWKCKWCAVCQVCGATDPGFNCSWMNSFTECGPCASHSACPSCGSLYNEGDLIIQCTQCERWLHGNCDSIKTELEAEKCADEGYTCLLCRPRDVPPPHLHPLLSPKPVTPCKSPELKSNANYYMDGVYLSEVGYGLIKSLTNEQSVTRKKRKKLIGGHHDKEAGIMATIESVVAGSSMGHSNLDDSTKLELIDFKDDPQDLYKEGMLWTKEDGAPPEGFTLYTMESGVSVLRRKRQRNLQKLGIGGFLVRVRGIRGNPDNDDVDTLPGQNSGVLESANSQSLHEGEKPRRKPVRRKPKSKLTESFPSYLQEAFFGKELLQSTKEMDSTSDSDDDSSKTHSDKDRVIQLSQEEVKPAALVKKSKASKSYYGQEPSAFISKVIKDALKEEPESDTEVLKDVLALPGDLLDTDLVNTIMSEDNQDLKHVGNLDSLPGSNIPDSEISESLESTTNSKDTKDELTDILGSHFNIESIPNINSKDVEDIFKNVLTDESQESQESSAFPISNANTFPSDITQPLMHQLSAPIRPNTLPTVNQNSLNSPVSFPSQSPYHSEYSNSPQFSPAFSEPPSPWVTLNETAEIDTPITNIPSTYNQRSAEKMKADEGLGSGATISAVLYANMNHPEWKTDYPLWNDRYKQIIKKWRTLSTEQKAPYLQQARDNRSALRMKKQQQINKESTSSPIVTKVIATSVSSIPSTQASVVAPVSEDQEKITQQQKTAREAEQERQWKQLQALRQQQAQQQQHVLHEHRTQAIANVQRSLSDGSVQSVTEQVGVLQSASQPVSPAPPSPVASSHLYPINAKPNQISSLPSPSSQILPQSLNPTPVNALSDKNVPKSSINSSLNERVNPKTPFTTPHTDLQAYSQTRTSEGPDINRQLRDLLQRQQFKKLDQQVLPGKGQQRIWPPNESNQENDQSQNSSTGDATFRHPLPPGFARPRAAATAGVVLRQPANLVGLRLQGLDPRLQNVEFRMRYLLQQQLQQRGIVPMNIHQQFQSATPRFPQQTVTAVQNAEQYEHIQKQTQLQDRVPKTDVSRANNRNVQQLLNKSQPISNATVTEKTGTDQEIPDNVTAELEKLEQETGTIAELQGVNDIFGGLGEDDDELLAEMGADFNILEYADPELDTLGDGEKTNILDSLDLVEHEPVKAEKRVQKVVSVPSKMPSTEGQAANTLPKPPITTTINQAVVHPEKLPRLLPPPLVVSQQQAADTQPKPTTSIALTAQQQIHQQMLHQVQQAASMGRPMSLGTKLMSPEGIIGVVTANNNVSLTFPANYAQRIITSHMQLQNQKLQMRIANVGPGPRMVAMPAGTSVQGSIQNAILAGLTTSRLGVGQKPIQQQQQPPPPPPPPPPYPGPPPPYPGSTSQEQPLLLEDLLEQEKREQEKQLQTHSTLETQDVPATSRAPALLSDRDFERLKADVFNSNNIELNTPNNSTIAAAHQSNQSFSNPTDGMNRWQQSPTQNTSAPPPPSAEAPPQIPTFNVSLLPAPPLPPETIVTEQDKQSQIVYEQWLNNQNTILSQQLKYYETEVQKLRKIRKSLNSKQRQLRKTGNQLAEADAMELHRISSEQSVLQKHLESSRKQSRQHGMLIQEYRNKQQAKQRPGQLGLLPGQPNTSPLGPPGSSPIHHTPQSPMMSPSPSASPMMLQHGSPMQSPRPLITHSPGPSPVTSVIHSPNNPLGNISPMQPSPLQSSMQPSPKVGTPHSQSEGSPGSAQSPSQVYLPPPASRMTSPQQRRVVTSPVAYLSELRNSMQQTRFIRPPSADQQQKPRLSISTATFLQRPGTPSPMNSPPPQPQIHLAQQQLMQKQLQQQVFLQQSTDGVQVSMDTSLLHSQRAMQLIQQRQLILRQQQILHHQQQNNSQAQLLTSQHQLIVQQQQLAKQQQQLSHIQAQVQNTKISISTQGRQSSSPMPPSPLLNQGQTIMSPHSIHSQPASPRLCLNPPNSPIARSPVIHQSMNQPPSPMVHHQQQQISSPIPRSPILGNVQSPLGMRRPPSTSNSPAMSDCPQSVENPGTPRTPYTPPSYIENDFSGGGNIHNPIPFMPEPGRYTYFKLGLRGGSPMWSLGRGIKKMPSPSENKEETLDQNKMCIPTARIKKESHLNKVSILKKKITAKSNLRSLVGKFGSLVSSDYNELDDSSCTPPLTPPLNASTSKSNVYKGPVRKLHEQPDGKEQVVGSNSTENNCEDVMDYDDDTDNGVVSTEVSLNSVAQQPDSDDISVIETFSQSDLGDTISSPLESGQIGDEFLLFPGNMVVDMSNTNHYSDKEEDEYADQILNVAIQSPTPSEEELIIQGKTKSVTTDSLTLNLVQGLSSNQLLTVRDTSESPEQEDMNMDAPTPEQYSHHADDDLLTHLDDSDIVIIDPSIKSPEISTTEDFEKLIDEGSKKEKILKHEMVTNEMHKYLTSPNCVTSAPSLNQTITLSTQCTSPKIAFIPAGISNSGGVSLTKNNPVQLSTDVVITRTTKLSNTTTPNLTSIILPLKTTVAPTLTLVSTSSSRFTIPVISASAISKLPNVKVIDKPSSSLSLAAHDACLPKKIFDDESSVSPDSSTCDDDKPKNMYEKKSVLDGLSIEDQFIKKVEQSSEISIIKNAGAIETSILSNKSKSNESDFRKSNIDSMTSSPTATLKLDCPQFVNLKDHIQNFSNPVTSKSSSPVNQQTTPELKMTAQIVQDKQSLQIAGNKRETIAASFITTQDVVDCSNDSDTDTKSVVISIPSPTPSQEQMLDNMALQALENRRRDGKGMPSGFDTFDDVLDMIENITGEGPSLLESNISEKNKNEEIPNHPVIVRQDFKIKDTIDDKPQVLDTSESTKMQTPVTVSTSARSTVMPQLSPLSQPTDLTTNMANVSQQLRTLLSSLHTTTVTSSPIIATVVKSVTHKEKVMPNVSVCSTASAISSRIIQRTHIPPPVSNTNLILPTGKPKHIITSFAITSPDTNNSVVLTTSTSAIPTSVTKVLPLNGFGGIQLMPDHPKLPPVTTVAPSPISNSAHPTTVAQKPSTVITSTLHSMNVTTRNPSLSLNAMLQSHPAATIAQTAPGTITAASLLGPPITIAKSSFTPSLVHAQPLVVSPIVTNSPQFTSGAISTGSSDFIQTSSGITAKPTIATSNFLHSQLTKTIYFKEKQNEPSVSESIGTIAEEIKKEVTESLSTPESYNAVLNMIYKSDAGGCKYSSIHGPSKIEDSQNVLLKQLLQNTACATTVQTQVSTPPNSSPAITTPNLPLVPNLEAQLARPVPPTTTSLLPPLLQNDNCNNQNNKSVLPKVPMVTRETSFVSKPVPPSPTISSVPTQQLHLDLKKCGNLNRASSRDDLLSPPTPKSSNSQDSNLQTPPLIIKKEYHIPPPQSPLLYGVHEVKKELIDETSQHSEVSDHSRPDLTHVKEEIDSPDAIIEKTSLEQKEELKKMKRRVYQQKRRQNQILNKDSHPQPKKRPRKSSKVDEDYDSYIDSLLIQLRALPSMIVQEPQLNRNFGVVPVFGSGDLSKVGLKVCNSRVGDLNGSYGNAIVPGFSDYYSSKPYGNIEPMEEKSTPSTQRGFYDQEFPVIKFDADEDRKFELFCRENDSPDSIVSSSSPECSVMEPYAKFLGLKLIDEDEDDEDDTRTSAKMRSSPIIPIIAPIPIRLKPIGPYLKDYTEQDKENICKDYFVKTKYGANPPTPLKDSGNVTVTLTLTSSAAEDIMGVLRDLANILHIPPPTSYQIVERTSTPPSQKLGLYRTKGKDGKEGAPIDIQTILNGAAKFCRHCDVVILNNMIRKKVSELPFLFKDTELLSDGDELYFCGVSCYMQFAIMHRSPSISEDKVAAIVDHLCQKDKLGMKRKNLTLEQTDKFVNENIFGKLNTFNKMGVEIKTEPMNLDFVKAESAFSPRMTDFNFLSRKHHLFNTLQQMPQKLWKGVKYKCWSLGCFQSPAKNKKPMDKEIMELLYKMGITLVPSKMPEDTRRCMFCQGVGDGVADGPARLLNFDVDKWVHLNCALWSDGVYETVNGALMNLENAIQQSLGTTCIHCNRVGATIRCFKTRCSNIYHLSCAVKDGCVFYKNKTIYCPSHILKNEKDNELTTLSVSRRVYVNRDENRQVAAVMHHASDTNNLLRVGNLIFLNVGQLLPHQLQNFHSSNYIYPIGYKIVRFYWSIRKLNKRCSYICSIHDVVGRPEFRVVIKEPPEEDVEFRDSSAKAVWNRILEVIASNRRENHCLQLFPKYFTGEDLFGLTEPAVVRVLESLPGVETLTDYKFKYGRNPLLELPLAINPSGAARTEPKLRNQFHWKRPHTQRTGSSVRPTFVPTPQGIGEAVCPYSKQFVHSKSSQYKKMKQEWKTNVYLARSKIQGLGLYAARDLEKHTMVIEYIGEIIRTELAETREKKYEAKNRGIYMFRLDEERVIDATLCGGLARYINHSCNPNCVAEIVEVDRDLRIIIFAKRRIQRGEELAYDYKFDIEDDKHKIACMCGAPNCKKWMN